MPAVDIELVTDVERLDHFVNGWDALADRVCEPRSGGAIVAGWARHMKSQGSDLRVWIATDGSEVIGVLPLATETMARGRLRLLPTATNMMYGTVPIAHPDRAREVAEAVVDDFALHSELVDLASIFWLPEGSPWTDALQTRFHRPDWVTTDATQYTSCSTKIDAGIEIWLHQRNRKFRKEVQRQARRAEEQGFRLFTVLHAAEIMDWLPHLQALYLQRREDRGGEGYEFDGGMVSAIGAALELSDQGHFALSVLERDGAVIGATMATIAGTTMSCWIVAFDREWSPLGPGIAVLVESLSAGARAGCRIADLGVGDEPYKADFLDEPRPLESVTWCRPRLARLLQLSSATEMPAAGGGPGADRVLNSGA
jgi:CelD/BcsL family acetyltransferase involved in cellulose biosynthesis